MFNFEFMCRVLFHTYMYGRGGLGGGSAGDCIMLQRCHSLEERLRISSRSVGFKLKYLLSSRHTTTRCLNERHLNLFNAHILSP